MKTNEPLPTTDDRQVLMNFIIEKFEIFNPQKDSKDQLPKEAGNYVVLLRKETPFPTELVSHKPIIHDIKLNGKEYQLIYTGIAKPDSKSSNLKKRIADIHFGDKTNAGKSTLRLSLGSLMGYIKIYRDQRKQHKKFKIEDELKLTEWMKENLLVLYYENSSCKQDEEKMISVLNPPLNIDDNNNSENEEFRDELSSLRSKKKQFEPIVE